MCVLKLANNSPEASSTNVVACCCNVDRLIWDALTQRDAPIHPPTIINRSSSTSSASGSAGRRRGLHLLKSRWVWVRPQRASALRARVRGLHCGSNHMPCHDATAMAGTPATTTADAAALPLSLAMRRHTRCVCGKPRVFVIGFGAMLHTHTTPTTPQTNYPPQQRTHTSKIHRRSDALVNLKLALAWTDPALYAQAIALFHPIYEVRTNVRTWVGGCAAACGLSVPNSFYGSRRSTLSSAHQTTTKTNQRLESLLPKAAQKEPALRPLVEVRWSDGWC